MENVIGRNIGQLEGYNAFVPSNVCDIKFELTEDTLKGAHDAALAVGKLDGVSKLLPDIDFFLFMYIRKDATHSSNIEGTQATLIESIEQEAKVSSKIPEDVSDIIQYIKAMNKGFESLERIPISNRFIRLLHKELMEGGRESHYSDPGNFRTSQNWIGGKTPQKASFVPPPPSEVNRLMGELETFLHRRDNIPPIVKAGIIHAHFETIHPFLDGNGRTGRLLITFFLSEQKMLEKPILFLSSFFMGYRREYYDGLMSYHNGEYKKWIDFFLFGVAQTANESIGVAERIVKIRESDMAKISGLSRRASETALRIYPNLFALPIVNVAKVAEWGGLTRTGAQKVINRFVDMGILKPRDPDKNYGRSYEYEEYLRVFVD
ncbi:MAG: Fic family protein [Candidatus Dadabacteria bacterium]|nr:Fic family protein [Candidatus Dadabacteria bacterium]